MSRWIAALAFACQLPTRVSPGDARPLDTGTGDDPCTVRLTAQTEVVRSRVNGVLPNRTFWVCAGGDLDSAGANVRIVAQPGATVDISGAKNEVWVRRGASIDIAGAFARVIHEDRGDIDVVGKGPMFDECARITVDAELVDPGC